MAKYKPDKYDQMVLIPLSLQNQLQPGTLEFTIHELVEKHIDLSVFEPRYHNDDTGATAIHPNIVPMPFGRPCSKSFYLPIHAA